MLNPPDPPTISDRRKAMRQIRSCRRPVAGYQALGPMHDAVRLDFQREATAIRMAHRSTIGAQFANEARMQTCVTFPGLSRCASVTFQ